MIIAVKQPITTIAAIYQRRHRSLSVPPAQPFRAAIAAFPYRHRSPLGSHLPIWCKISTISPIGKANCAFLIK